MSDAHKAFMAELDLIVSEGNATYLLSVRKEKVQQDKDKYVDSDDEGKEPEGADKFMVAWVPGAFVAELEKAKAELGEADNMIEALGGAVDACKKQKAEWPVKFCTALALTAVARTDSAWMEEDIVKAGDVVKNLGSYFRTILFRKSDKVLGLEGLVPGDEDPRTALYNWLEEAQFVLDPSGEGEIFNFKPVKEKKDKKRTKSGRTDSNVSQD